jgi:non-ribosomal peptide synthetase component F
VRENFFELGGHSLLATQVMSRVRETFRIEVPLRALFESPTVADFALKIEQALRTGAGTEVPPIVTVGRDRPLPLSFAQQRLWFIDQLEPGSSSYNVPAAVRLSGGLNVAALERTLSEIIRRHEVLRTTFAVRDGEPVQVIHEAAPLSLEVLDLSGLDEAEREAEALSLAAAEVRHPFDLARGPLLRVKLIRLGEQEHLVLMVMHHIVTDGWSVGVLIREVAALYEAYAQGQESPLDELPVQYADFAVWQREWLQGEALEAQLAYWREQLAGAPEVLELPTDRPRSATRTHRGAHEAMTLTEELSERLRVLSRRSGVTLYMTLLAAWQTLLHHYSGQDDIVVGTDVANRNRAETEPLIGFFVNMLVLRTNLSGDPTFSELLKRVREVCLGAYAYQDVPFEKLVEELRPERTLSHAPLFQMVFTLQNAPAEDLKLPGLRLSAVEADHAVAKFDLVFNLQEVGGKLVGGLEYSTDLFDAPTVARILKHYETLLEGVAAQPNLRLSELEILSDEEKGLLNEAVEVEGLDDSFSFQHNSVTSEE